MDRLIAILSEVATEREHQKALGFDAHSDFENNTVTKLMDAAACIGSSDILFGSNGVCIWPWFHREDKYGVPGTYSDMPKRQRLIIAAALIAAAIELGDVTEEW